MFLLVLNVWIICGLISYYKIMYIEKFHEDEWFHDNLEFDPRYYKPISFIVCILGGLVALVWLIWYDLGMLWIDIRYWIGTAYDKIFKK